MVDGEEEAAREADEPDADLSAPDVVSSQWREVPRRSLT